MSWSFSNDKPIFQQLKDIIVLKIIKGEYPPGAKLEGVRELAVNAGVNPNTMQRALSDVEETGIIYTMRGDGRYVTDDKEKINEVRSAYVAEKIDGFLNSVGELGLDKKEILDAIHFEIEKRGEI